MGLLSSRAIREPAPTFSLFTGFNEGGVVMNWLYAGVSDSRCESDRIATSVASVAELGERIRLSRSHLMRKLRAAEAMGSLGWTGERGRSTMWLSSSFLREYRAQQSAKLAIIDHAFRHAVEA